MDMDASSDAWMESSRISSGAPEPLFLHKLVSWAVVQKCIADNLLVKPSGEWLGLRQTAEVAPAARLLVGDFAVRSLMMEAVSQQCAIACDSFYEDQVSSDSHVMLRVTFTPLGVALFSSTFTDGTNNFRPILSKKVVCGDTDWGKLFDELSFGLLLRIQITTDQNSWLLLGQYWA